MKKFLLFLFSILAFLPAKAQEGMWGVGADITGGVINLDHNFTERAIYGVTGKVQYNFSSYYRIQPFISYYGGVSKPEILIGIDNHIFFKGVRKYRPFINLGLAFGHLADKLRYTDSEGYIDVLTETYNTIVLKGGLGYDIRLSRDLSFQIQLSCDIVPRAEYWYQIMDYIYINDRYEPVFYSPESRNVLRIDCRLDIGFTYNF